MERQSHLSPRVKAMLEETQHNLQTEGTLPIGIFNDDELHQAEMEHLFGKQWNFIGHESEIPGNGDYVLRYIGTDKFILVRDEDGEIRVLLDACPHRGVNVCRAEKGNASHFRCIYHGWIFKNNGELIGAPSFKDAYKGLEKEKWGLVPAPRVENFYGFIFVSLAEEGPTLREAMGDMAWYLEMVFTLQEEGMEVLGEPQRSILNANWKQAAENFSGDDYHLLYLHKSTYDVGAIPVPLVENMKGYHIKAGNGNALSFSIDKESDAPIYWFFPEEIVKTFNLESMSEEQQKLARGARVIVGNLFPNASFLMLPLSADPSSLPPVPLFTWRVWRPVGPDKIEWINWFFMYKNTPAEFKAESYRSAMANFGISGIFEMDDTAPWEGSVKVAGAPFAKKALKKLNYQMGMEGMSSSKVVEDWPFPGEAWYPRFEEGNQRHFYSHYLKAMLNND